MSVIIIIPHQAMASNGLVSDQAVNEPAHGIMVLFVLHKLIRQTRVCSHPVRQDV